MSLLYFYNIFFSNNNIMVRKKTQNDIFSDLFTPSILMIPGSILPKIKTKKQKGRGCGASCEASARATVVPAPPSRASAALGVPAPRASARAPASGASVVPTVPAAPGVRARASAVPTVPAASSGEPAAASRASAVPTVPAASSRAASRASTRARAAAASVRASARASAAPPAEFDIIKQYILERINNNDYLIEYITNQTNKDYIDNLYNYFLKNKSTFYLDSKILNYDGLFIFLISQDWMYWFSISQLKNRVILDHRVTYLFNRENYTTLRSIIEIKEFIKMCIVIRDICKILLNTGNKIDIYGNSLFIIKLLSTSEETNPLERCKQGIIEMIDKLIKIDQIEDNSIDKLAKLRLKIIKNIHPEYANITQQDLLDIKNR